MSLDNPQFAILAVSPTEHLVIPDGQFGEILYFLRLPELVINDGEFFGELAFKEEFRCQEQYKNSNDPYFSSSKYPFPAGAPFVTDGEDRWFAIAVDYESAGPGLELHGDENWGWKLGMLLKPTPEVRLMVCTRIEREVAKLEASLR